MKKLFTPLWASLTAVAAGAGMWWFVSAVAHRREAWDAPVYFTFALPAMAAVAAALAFAVPERPLRWAMLPFAGQALVAVVKDPSANLLPLGLIMFGLLGLVCWVPAALGAMIRRKVSPR